jgi:hypothetical protein
MTRSKPSPTREDCAFYAPVPRHGDAGAAAPCGVGCVILSRIPSGQKRIAERVGRCVRSDLRGTQRPSQFEARVWDPIRRVRHDFRIDLPLAGSPRAACLGLISDAQQGARPPGRHAGPAHEPTGCSRQRVRAMHAAPSMPLQPFLARLCLRNVSPCGLPAWPVSHSTQPTSVTPCSHSNFTDTPTLVRLSLLRTRRN